MITWSYIAGFLDGDGWIGKCYLKSGRPIYLAGVTQVALQKELMLEIHKFLINNGINSKFKVRNKNNWKSSLKMVNVTVKEQKSLLKFLTKIKPYLLIKKALAEEVVIYLKKRIKTRNLKPLPSKNKRYWSNSDCKKLYFLVNKGMSNVEISHRLNRGTGAVAHKIKRLKIHHRLHYVA